MHEPVAKGKCIDCHATLRVDGRSTTGTARGTYGVFDIGVLQVRTADSATEPGAEVVVAHEAPVDHVGLGVHVSLPADGRRRPRAGCKDRAMGGRFLFVTWDGGGNVNPVLGLAPQLVAVVHGRDTAAAGVDQHRNPVGCGVAIGRD